MTIFEIDVAALCFNEVFEGDGKREEEEEEEANETAMMLTLRCDCLAKVNLMCVHALNTIEMIYFVCVRFEMAYA